LSGAAGRGLAELLAAELRGSAGDGQAVLPRSPRSLQWPWNRVIPWDGYVV